MSFCFDHNLPRCTTVLLSGNEFTKIRSRVASALAGDVLDAPGTSRESGSAPAAAGTGGNLAPGSLRP